MNAQQVSDIYALESMPYAQCRVVFHYNTNIDTLAGITLVSYETAVILIRRIDGVWKAKCTGTYSTTTARHINRFTTEFFGTNMYHFFKTHLDEWCELLDQNMPVNFWFKYCYSGEKEPLSK